MRVFITVLVLIFSLQSWTKAEDIRDFQIEGMSIGDSLLDYYPESEIIRYKETPYKNKKWSIVARGDSTFKTYGGFQAHVKTNDSKYIIGSLEGMILYENKMKECYKQQKEIILELDNLFKNSKILEWNKPHSADGTGDSISKVKQYRLQNDDIIRVTCIDWSVQMGMTDKLKVAIYTKEFDLWINNEAYK